MTYLIIPEGKEIKYCVWASYNDCLKNKILGVGDDLIELDKQFPDKKYPKRVFGITFVKKVN